ncbi:hypothetical protein J717_4085 [Acinetobacter baumannii 121738]|nr:hypothetical protein J717_4085 [Acinetobacter baumannii 121738]
MTREGGEVKFLNHLCDEQHITITSGVVRVFLNHLCDEQLQSMLKTWFLKFLNHLCDEQQPLNTKGFRA